MNRRHISIVLLGIFSYLLFLRPVFAEGIREFTASYDIQTDGRVNAQEYMVYDFEDSYRHGIFRTIPFIKTNAEGKKFVLDFGQFSVHDDKDHKYNFSVTKSETDVSVKIGDANKTITG